MFWAWSIALVSLTNTLPTLAAPPHPGDDCGSDILNRAIQALGGAGTLTGIQGISYHSYLLRTQSLEESLTPGIPNVGIAVSGSETVSYDFSARSSNDSQDVIQRIDKHYSIGNFLNFARPNLDPVDASIVVRGGNNGFACYVKGNEHVLNDASNVFGYTDAFLANVLVRDALRLSPKLLLIMKQNQHSTKALNITYHEIGPFPAVHDSSLNITVVFDPQTFLPYLVRSYEDHRIFGNSTNDFVLSNYTEVQGMKFPQTVQIMYNEDKLLLHTLRDTITINPSFADDFFTGIPLSQINQTFSTLPPTVPEVSSVYGTAEVFENNANLVWYGPYRGSLEKMTFTNPIPELPNLYNLVFEGSVYACTVGVFDDAVMVTDAPPHQSKLVIQWVEEHLQKNVTHLLVTHHHHDHNYGAADFVAAGAKLVVPERYTYYWQNISGVQFETVTEDKPFKHKDSHMQVRAMWHNGFAHAEDWMYFMWTLACPKDKSPVAATIADAWSPGFVGFEFDHVPATNYLDNARRDRMPHDYIVFPIHGTPTNVTELYELLGYAYPKYKTTDFIAGGPLC